MRQLHALLSAVFLAAVFLGVMIGAVKLDAAQQNDLPPGQSANEGFFLVEPFVTGLIFPVDIAFAPDGLLFVAERLTDFNPPITATILVVDPAGTVQDQPFAVVTVDDSTTSDEKGLLGLAVDPDYAANHYLYAYYTAPPDEGNLKNHGELVRYTVVFTNGNWQGSDKTILVDNLPVSNGCCHNGGALAFGPDGKLYLSIGDNGGGGNSQNLGTLAGDILRYNPDGTIPPDNPFTQTVGAQPAIFAYGLRNPFGFDWHPFTAHMFATENGPNCNDELNHIIPGGNYGWATIQCAPHPDPFIEPIWILDPPEGLTGAAFYTPTISAGPLLYMTAWNSGNLFEAKINDQGMVDQVQAVWPDCGQAENYHGLALALHPAGDLYLSCMRSSTWTGSIFRIRFVEVVTPTGLAYLAPGTGGMTGDGLAYDPDDLLRYDFSTAAWSLHFDGGAAGLAGATIDAALLLDSNRLMLSFADPADVPGLGTVDDSDLVTYRFSNGLFELTLDGSDVGLTTPDEDIDALAVNAAGRLLVSTSGPFTVRNFPTGLLNGDGSDLITFLNRSFGADSQGRFQLYFDGSDVGLNSSLDGASVTANGDLYFSPAGPLDIGFPVDGDDVILCSAPATGPDSACNSLALYWDAAASGLGSGTVNALHLEP